MTSKQTAQTQVWEGTHKTCDTKALGGFMHGLYRAIYSQRTRWERNWLYVSDYDLPSNKLAWNCRIANGRNICHSDGYSGAQGHVNTYNTTSALLWQISAMISTLVNKTWFSRYPHCQYVIYDNGSKFKLHFEALCDRYGIKHKPTSVKNPQANAIVKRVHQVMMAMICTA